MDSTGSWESVSDDGNAEDDDDDDDEGKSMGMFSGAMAMAMGGFQFGVGRLSFYAGANAGAAGEAEGFPSKMDLDRNFLEDEAMDEEEAFYDVDSHDEEDDGDEEPLYPGLYRALYAFQPEGTAEMALEEDQIVRVVGRGGGVGWAVVVDDRERKGEEEKLALVPESYLEPVRLDGVDE
jgi:hypothetical protein